MILVRKPESVQKYEIYKILGGFEIQTDYLILGKRQELVFIKKKKNYYLVDFAVPVDHKMKVKESEKTNK